MVSLLVLWSSIFVTLMAKNQFLYLRCRPYLIRSAVSIIVVRTDVVIRDISKFFHCLIQHLLCLEIVQIHRILQMPLTYTGIPGRCGGVSCLFCPYGRSGGPVCRSGRFRCGRGTVQAQSPVFIRWRPLPVGAYYTVVPGSYEA